MPKHEPQPIRLYLIHLNPDARGLVDRYSVLRLGADGELVPLWGDYVDPEKPGSGRKAAKAWPHMVYQARPSSGPDKYPAFHFALHGYGYSKPYELADSLANALGWPIELYRVSGWRSSAERAKPRQLGTRKAAIAKLESRL